MLKSFAAAKLVIWTPLGPWPYFPKDRNQPGTGTTETRTSASASARSLSFEDHVF
jgi:hypothetical protein